MPEASENHECSYLPGRSATTRYRWLESCDAATYQRMLERGWRRFGRTFFRPECGSCQECRSLRLNIGSLVPDRSMRRTWNKNGDLQILLGSPTLSLEHLDLFARFHLARSRDRGWEPRGTTPQDYYLSFVDGAHDYGAELQLRLDGRLLAVALVDILPAAMSAVYCYYDPEFKDRGLGTMAILSEVEIAKIRSIPHLFLGYWVEPNASMRYKARFRPHEILIDRPLDEESVLWQEVGGAPARKGKKA